MISKFVRHYQQGVAMTRFQGTIRHEFGNNTARSSFWAQNGVSKMEYLAVKQQHLLPEAWMKQRRWIKYVDESETLTKIKNKILSNRNFSGRESRGHEYATMTTPVRFMLGASNKVQIFTVFSLVSQQLVNMSMKNLTANSEDQAGSFRSFFVPGSLTVFQGFASVFKDEDTKLDNVLHKLITSVVVPSIMNSPFAMWIYFMFYYRMKMVMSIKGDLPWDIEGKENISTKNNIHFLQNLLVA